MCHVISLLVFLHVRCIPHQNSLWQFWASKCVCECAIGINAKRHNYLQYLCCKLEVRTPIIPPPNTHCGAICLQLIYSLNMLKRNHRQTACKQMLRFAALKSGENPWEPGPSLPRNGRGTTKKSSCDWRLLPSTFAFWHALSIWIYLISGVDRPFAFSRACLNLVSSKGYKLAEQWRTNYSWRVL